MQNSDIADRLRKLAAEIKEQCAKSKQRMAKTATTNTVVKLDPQRVLDFMLFYGRH